ncbi:hypothetical protein HBH56_156510 [Parastagonospora nodorum]|uniref:Uncharacterized protein n=2 Tax=Phaeosphaeria nodorum (strain SN15 / ATCC MYA-4574 / FGSC 10173) TaxID=321614 RepID=A0A7U2F2M0_PHANO|nr:hypothetical protein SNOG_08687 [Parastagonospora nodorum SN15]KAH3909434.1 hypothetical protein HBH56_156510 [Parastagonospora nodorum]EAT83855.1 hypothetical protein SNOG_08687 [Parastagonospora nodorum SN15]KAH3922964.1 hypothetical protein HBH54_218210 [Parastagonospora nodorum]KAH4127566.1 hypothetical protein HBH45_216200 [Parastagonospora nodorum]KAH4148916.1 hypothetical protein HBH44_201070 [Parastagonospora nodorum]
MSTFTPYPTTLQDAQRYWVWNYIQLENLYIVHFDSYPTGPAGKGFFFSRGMPYMGPDQKELDPQSIDREMWRELASTPGVAIRKCTNETKEDENEICEMLFGTDEGEKWAEGEFCSRNVVKRGEYAVAKARDARGN